MAWQVRRLRFAIEVDCDARVLRSGVGLNEYGHTLLAVSTTEHRPIGSPSMAARRSLLEMRLSILAAIKPVNVWLVAGFVALCACCLAAAAALPVPRERERQYHRRGRISRRLGLCLLPTALRWHPSRVRERRRGGVVTSWLWAWSLREQLTSRHASTVNWPL